jgi:hypothetical protein
MFWSYMMKKVQAMMLSLMCILTNNESSLVDAKIHPRFYSNSMILKTEKPDQAPL